MGVRLKLHSFLPDRLALPDRSGRVVRLVQVVHSDRVVQALLSVSRRQRNLDLRNLPPDGPIGPLGPEGPAGL
jgi:hypothetical protein